MPSAMINGSVNQTAQIVHKKITVTLLVLFALLLLRNSRQCCSQFQHLGHSYSCQNVSAQYLYRGCLIASDSMYGQEEKTQCRYVPQAELLKSAVTGLSDSSVIFLPSLCKVIQICCCTLDTTQRFDSPQPQLWHAWRHTRLTHTIAQTTMCGSFMFIISVRVQTISWEEIIVIAALNHLTTHESFFSPTAAVLWVKQF